MLRAAAVPEALESICVDGVKGALLMTRDGSLLGSAGDGMAGVLDKRLGAIASSVWDDMAKAAHNGSGEMLQVMLLDFENGRLGITAAASHLICAFGGTDVAEGDIRTKLLALRQAVEHELEAISM